MRSIVVAAGLATPALAGTPDAPIIGGTPTQLGEFPNVVAIQVEGKLCTGTLITPEWVITAAHCVLPSSFGLPSQDAVTASMHVHVATVDLGTSPGRTLRAVDTIPDPAFDMNALGAHDIGLIQLATPIEMAPLQLNTVAANAPIGIAVTKVGFGVTAAEGAAGVEHAVSLTSDACSSQIGSNSNLLCFDQTGGKGICGGDSGSPALATIDGHHVLVGVTSFADDDCAKFSADSRIDAEAQFVLKHVPDAATCDTVDCSGEQPPEQAEEDDGGCTTSGGATLLVGIAALGLLRRRRAT